MYALLIEGGSTPEKPEAMDRLVTDEMIPGSRPSPGVAGALNVVDRDKGDAMMIVLWETEAQARAALGRAGERQRRLGRGGPAFRSIGGG